MGIIRSSVSMLQRGRIGAIGYYTSKGRQYTRAAQNSSNYGTEARRTIAQQNRRVLWANLVNLWKGSQSWGHLAFENKKDGTTDYNKFMSLNINRNRIALTKDEAASGACVVDAYQVTEGSLFPIVTAAQGDVWVTNIATTLDSIGAATTIGELTENLLANNAFLRNNMQISFVSYQQFADANGIPRVICTPYELTLATNSTELVRDYMPAFAMSVTDGFISTSNKVSPGAFVYVLSETRSGKTYVSTQSLIANNANMIAQYISNSQVTAAIDSYGVDSSAFLESGSTAREASPQPMSILQANISTDDPQLTSVTFNGSKEIRADFGGGDPISIDFSAEVKTIGKLYARIRERTSVEPTWQEVSQEKSPDIIGSAINWYVGDLDFTDVQLVSGLRVNVNGKTVEIVSPYVNTSTSE